MMDEFQFWSLSDGKIEGAKRLIFRNPPVNTLSFESQRELGLLLTQLESSEDIRVLTVESGTDGYFCSGAEITELDVLSSDASAREVVGGLHSLFSRLENLPQITIAVLDGSAVGGGTELALACDFRVARSEIRFGLPEIKLGLIPGGGGTQRLSKIVGQHRALHLILSGKLLKGSDAQTLGLIDRISETGGALDLADALVIELGAAPGIAMKAAKRAVKASGNAFGYEVELEEFVRCAGSDDMKEGVAAFLERRKPNFRHC